MIRITASISILILLILILRKCFYYQITRKMQYKLWLAIPLYLVLVPFVHIKLPLYNNINLPVIEKQWKMYTKQSQIKNSTDIEKNRKIQGNSDKYLVIQNTVLQNGKARQQMGKYNLESRVDILYYTAKVIKIIYYIVITVFATLVILKNIVFILYCKRNRKYYKTDQATGIKIFILENSYVPFLLGKCIYISKENTENWQYLKYIILHEYCHWKQRDMFWKIVQSAIKVFFWYNPLVWIASRYKEYDCELACDEAVIKISGKDNIQQYGDTLLYLALKHTAKCYKNIIATSIGGKKCMLKERISYIVSEKKNKKTSSIETVLLTIILLAGLLVSFPDKPQAIEKNKTASGGNNISQINDINFSGLDKEKHFTENNYYNYMKSDGQYIYFPWNNSLYRINIKTGKSRKISGGFFRLGDITGGYLYYTKIEQEDLTKTEKGIVITGRMLLEDLSEETICKEESENFWGFSQPYVAEDGTVYVEEEIGTVQKCHTYKFNKTINKWESNSSYICKALEKSKEELYPYNNCIYLYNGYIKNLIEKEKIFFINPSASSILINNINGRTLKEINNYNNNLLFTEKGFLYTDKKFNIHLCSYKEPFNDNIIFEPGKKFSYINYGVYDKNGIYGYCKNKNKEIAIVRLSWDGNATELYKTTKRLSGLSAFGNGISFFEGRQFKLVKY